MKHNSMNQTNQTQKIAGKRVIILFLAAVCLLSLSITGVAAESTSAPTLPAQFYGTVTDHAGILFPVGTVLIAEANGVTSTYTLKEAGKIGGSGTFDDKFLIAGVTDGCTIIFKVEGSSGIATYKYSGTNSGLGVLTLTISSLMTKDTRSTANAVTAAEVEYTIPYSQLNTITVPTFTRGKHTITMNEKVVVTKVSTGAAIPAAVDPSAGTVILSSTSGLISSDVLTVVFVGRKIGDVYADGVIDVGDNIRIARGLAGFTANAMTEYEQIYADVSGEGIVDVGDNILLARYLAGYIGVDYK